jgi:hypothetical protein
MRPDRGAQRIGLGSAQRLCTVAERVFASGLEAVAARLSTMQTQTRIALPTTREPG